MMYFIFQKNGNQKLTMNQLLHCLRRNFGGKSNVNEAIDMFLENVSVKELRRTEEITSDNVCNNHIIIIFYTCVHINRVMIVLHLV